MGEKIITHRLVNFTATCALSTSRFPPALPPVFNNDSLFVTWFFFRDFSYSTIPYRCRYPVVPVGFWFTPLGPLMYYRLVVGWNLVFIIVLCNRRFLTSVSSGFFLASCTCFSQVSWSARLRLRVFSTSVPAVRRCR